MTKNYHQKLTEKLRKEAHEKYQNISMEETEKRHNKNLSRKQKQKQCRINHYLTHNNNY